MRKSILGGRANIFNLHFFFITIDREIFVFLKIFRALKFHGAKFS